VPHRQGNGCAERNICTLKENLLWVRTFASVEELRQALLRFRDIYNATWLMVLQELHSKEQRKTVLIC
jgi:hypothetical protein